ncbi:MAG: rhodanese-like domain-containing protein [Bacilli bacterium]
MYKSIKASELKGMIGRVNIVDIRKNYLYNLGSIPSSKNIPSSFLLMNPEKYLDKEKEYYIYCMQGMESPKVCAKLSKQGYKVVNVLGGYHDYITS